MKEYTPYPCQGEQVVHHSGLRGLKAKISYLPEEINNLTNYAAGLIVAHDKRKFDCIMTQKSFLKSAR